MKKCFQIVACTTLLLLPVFTFAQDLKGISFSHGEWEIYCSNTGTCRAAGYNSDDANHLPASILLTRRAGAQQAVKAEFVLSHFSEHLPINKIKNIHLYVDGQDLGVVQLTENQKPLRGVLKPMQVQALLKNPQKNTQIIFKNQHYTWQIADQGMSAVLLKMDDFQKRIGTTGALIKKGSTNETNVLKPQPILSVHHVPTSSEPYQVLNANKSNLEFRQRLLSALPKNDECEGSYTGNKMQAQPLEFYTLTNNKVMVKTLCWRAAYNEGYGIWVLDEKLQSKPEFITILASDYEEGIISSAQKGRGIGDCWSYEQWVWNGKKFIKTHDNWTGMCKGLAAGGVWQLDLIESKVK